MKQLNVKSVKKQVESPL